MSDQQDIEVEIVTERLSDQYLISPNDLHRGRGPWAGLTPNARCLLAALLTHSSGWKLSRKEIDGLLAPLGRDAVSAVLRELREHGFITTKRINSGRGRFGWQWKISLQPQNVSAGRTIDGLTVDGRPVDGEPVDGADQAKQGVSAGRTIDGSTIDGQPVDIRSTPTTEVTKKDQKKATASPTQRPGPKKRSTAGAAGDHRAVNEAALFDAPADRSGAKGSSPGREPAGSTATATIEAPTVNQRARQLAMIYTNRIKLSNYNAVVSIVKKAMSDGVADEAIARGLTRLADEQTPVTAGALLVAVKGPRRPSRSGPYRNTGPGSYANMIDPEED